MNTWIAGSRPLKTATSSLPWPRNRTLKGQHNEAALKQMGRRRPSPCLAYFHRSTPNLQLEHWPWRMLVAQWTLTLHAGLIYLSRSPWELGQTGPVVGKGVRVTIWAIVTIRSDLRTYYKGISWAKSWLQLSPTYQQSKLTQKQHSTGILSHTRDCQFNVVS